MVTEIRRKEITREEYLYANQLSVKELNDWIEDRVDSYILFGYGFYGGWLSSENNKYYMHYTTLSSSD